MVPSEAHLTTHHLYPPFPHDIKTAPLERLSLKLLEQSGLRTTEVRVQLLKACETFGFFYLDLLKSSLGQTIIREAEELHSLQQKLFALDHESKDRFGRDKVDPFYSYRWTPCESGTLDAWGRAGRREMYSLRVDDFLGVRHPLPHHELVDAHSALFTSFSQHCRQVVSLILGSLEQGLRLPPSSLLELHDEMKPRGDFIALQHRAAEVCDDTIVRKGEHTDFGSITMLFNWLGGLQIREQDETGREGDWVWVKPIPGSCVINLADSLVKLTDGRVRSNIHRVAPAPGAQAGLPRYSLVYFAHPNDDVQLKPIVSESTTMTTTIGEGIMTAAEWVTRRSVGDLRGVYTYKGGIEPRDNNDAVSSAG